MAPPPQEAAPALSGFLRLVAQGQRQEHGPHRHAAHAQAHQQAQGEVLEGVSPTGSGQSGQDASQSRQPQAQGPLGVLFGPADCIRGPTAETLFLSCYIPLFSGGEASAQHSHHSSVRVWGR